MSAAHRTGTPTFTTENIMAMRTATNVVPEIPNPVPAAPSSSAQHQGHPANPPAQPVMSVSAPTDDPLADSRSHGDPVHPADGEIFMRRRSSSSGAMGARVPTGTRARAFVLRLGQELELKSDSGVRKGDLLMQDAGFAAELFEAILEQRSLYRPVMRALTGGKTRASTAQFAQALALSVFDLNRWVFTMDRCPGLTPELPLQQLPQGYDNEHLALLVSGAKQLTEFDNLRDVLVLWREVLVDLRGPEREGLYRYLTLDLGMFHANACRVIDAFAEAVQGGDDAGLMQRIPACLAKQWLTGPGEAELHALRRLAPAYNEQFHHKLSSQFLRICSSFGVNLPLPAELLLLEPPGQAKVSSSRFDARASTGATDADAATSSAACVAPRAPSST